MLFSSTDYNNQKHRYERQIKNVDHLVLNTIKEKKRVHIDMRDLYDILEVLYDYRVID